MILPDPAVEVLADLHRLAVHPSLEDAQQVLEDWDERKQLYNATESGWSRRSKEMPCG